MNLTRKVIDAILKLYQSRNGLTKRNSGIFGFYMMMWYLRDNGIATTVNGRDKREKVWILTDKGKKVAEKLIEIKNILGEDNES